MEYKLMSKEEAIKLLENSKYDTVMIAVQNLEEEDFNSQMKKINKHEGKRLIQESETITSVYDDFIRQLNLFSKMQRDIYNIKPKGIRKIIMLRE
ncbi:hypothetical protein [uncultured Robinsoniella sp.]|uniref:hypothetical protein n=1 Tax=uncultured Robinsoniella sp. TaxID=904190 RepID=UPI00374F0A89